MDQGMPQDKISTYMTLYTALVTVVKLAAPMIPFMSEGVIAIWYAAWIRLRLKVYICVIIRLRR